jgi:hypothetical protein
MTGLEVAERLRADGSGTPPDHRIALTGHRRSGHRASGMWWGPGSDTPDAVLSLQEISSGTECLDRAPDSLQQELQGFSDGLVVINYGFPALFDLGHG